MRSLPMAEATPTERGSPMPGKNMRKRFKGACQITCCAHALCAQEVLCTGEKAIPSSRQFTPSMVLNTL